MKLFYNITEGQYVRGTTDLAVYAVTDFFVGNYIPISLNIFRTSGSYQVSADSEFFALELAIGIPGVVTSSVLTSGSFFWDINSNAFTGSLDVATDAAYAFISGSNSNTAYFELSGYPTISSSYLSNNNTLDQRSVTLNRSLISGSGLSSGGSLGGLVFSVVSCSYSLSASYARKSSTSDYAVEANHAIAADNATYADTALSSQSSSYALKSATSDYAVEANHAIASDNATYADTAFSSSYALAASTATSANVAITSFRATTSSYAVSALSASYAPGSNNVSSSYSPEQIATNDIFAWTKYIGINFWPHFTSTTIQKTSVDVVGEKTAETFTAYLDQAIVTYVLLDEDSFTLTDEEENILEA